MTAALQALPCNPCGRSRHKSLCKGSYISRRQSLTNSAIGLIPYSKGLRRKHCDSELSAFLATSRKNLVKFRFEVVLTSSRVVNAPAPGQLEEIFPFLWHDCHLQTACRVKEDFSDTVEIRFSGRLDFESVVTPPALKTALNHHLVQ